MNRRHVPIVLAPLLLLAAIAPAGGSAEPVKVPPAPGKEKIVVLDPMLSQWALALRRPDRTGTLRLTEVGHNRYLEGVFPELAGNILATGASKLEELIRLEPSLILVKTGTDHATSDLARTGVEVVPVELERFDDLMRGLELLGARLAAAPRAARLAGWYRGRLGSLEIALIAGPAPKPTPRVYFAGANVYSACGREMFQNRLVERAGGRSVTAGTPGAKILVSLEELIALDPEVIVLPSYCADTAETIRANAKLKDLSAVRNGRIHVVPRYLTSWDMPVPESILGIEWLASILHPEIGIDLAGEAREFYAVFYDHAIPAGSLEVLLR